MMFDKAQVLSLLPICLMLLVLGCSERSVCAQRCIYTGQAIEDAERAILKQGGKPVSTTDISISVQVPKRGFRRLRIYRFSLPESDSNAILEMQIRSVSGSEKDAFVEWIGLAYGKLNGNWKTQVIPIDRVSMSRSAEDRKAHP